MSRFESTSRTRTRSVSKKRSTFMVEALLLLAIVLTLVAVTVLMFASALTTSAYASRLQQAAGIAQNAAESYIADPIRFSSEDDIDGYKLSCSTSRENMDVGTMYSGHISVSYNDEELCALDVRTYRYASDEPYQIGGGGSHQ